MIQVARFASFGPPRESIRAETLPPKSTLGHEEVRVRMRFSPINPADLNYIEGNYGIRPELPAIPGMEGSGEVIEVAPSVSRVRTGDSVLVLAAGNWCSERVLHESELVVLPADVDMAQASMLKVNPMTAWAMLRIVSPPLDAMVIQNAANSGVGRCVIQLSKEAGWRTINLVRRPELIQELRDLGADEVFLDIDESFQAIQANWKPQLGLNCVGGDSALRLAASLHEGGSLITYGAMSRKALKVPNGFLIFRDLRFAGFWLTKWLKTASHETICGLVQDLGELVKRKKLLQPVDQIFPISEVQAAVERAQAVGRSGKVLLAL